MTIPLNTNVTIDNDFIKVFRFKLSFKVPTEEGTNLDFITKSEDIFYAINEFNDKFQNSKNIKLISIEKQHIEILLYIKVNNKNIKVSGKDLSLFSRKLFHDREWSRYSRDKGKLFMSVLAKDITDEKKCNVMPYYIKIVPTPKNYLSVQDKILSDEKALIAFKSLLAIQDIGDTEVISYRKNTIRNIKKLLIKVLSK
ncbi:hypothetical protein [Clostridium sp. ZS2-4]|uniref:hypothetical protein n=1 Tax=Clostridium sp. ZS2-4 TaxID=2987703 RepID=UPI00227C7901|nr:hypothetical protein [Clostridium sp. ZS2-4]MCY6354358.1 hypothetical protein [Clostridium sp. ZS2-4]